MALALAVVPPAAAPSTLKVTVYIDRDLGLEYVLSLPVGSTVQKLKERVCSEDPTGETRPEDLKLVKVGSRRLLRDGETLSKDLAEIEILEDDDAAQEEEEQEQEQQQLQGKRQEEQEEKLQEEKQEEKEEATKPAEVAATPTSKAAEDEKPTHVPASNQINGSGGEEANNKSPQRQVFNLMDRDGKGKISQKDVLMSLKKQAPIRRLFGLPASKNEKGGDTLDAQLLAIQDAFEAGSGLGKLAPMFDKLANGSRTFEWESFENVFSARPHKTKLDDATALLPREHKSGPAFVPTKEWQEVPEGTVCPGGLEYKMDMTTQKTLARFAPGQSGPRSAAAPVAAPTTYKLSPGTEHVFLKRSEDPASGQIAKVKRSADYKVHSTGRVWVGPGGGRWTEIDSSKTEEKGWALLEGPGFGLKGPALVKHAEDVD